MEQPEPKLNLEQIDERIEKAIEDEREDWEIALLHAYRAAVIGIQANTSYIAEAMEIPIWRANALCEQLVEKGMIEKQ